jgi:inhibitor of nuclear factor kappa-B kinase subunit alpha
MAFSREDRILIKELRVAKGYSARRLLKEFPMKSWSRSGLNRLLKQITETGSAERKAGSGRHRSARTDRNIEAVEELVCSQDSNPGTHLSLRQISRETGIKTTSVHRIVHKHLRLKCFKKKRAQELTPSNKLCRLVRSKQLLRQYPQHKVPFIWFTDEKLFTVSSPKNSQNDRLYAAVGTKKKQISASRLLQTRSTFSKSVMVSVGVSALGCTHLIFVQPGAKINGAYYRDVLLSQQLLPAIRGLSGDHFIFQQDSAPAHRAYETIELLKRETPAFISPSVWPPNSPDLNPVDYKVWGVLQERVYRSRIRDVEHLKARLLEEWARFDQRIISQAISQWRKCLQACVRANCGHFEQTI